MIYFNVFISNVLVLIEFLSGSKITMKSERHQRNTLFPKWVPFETIVAFKFSDVLGIFEASLKGEEENVSNSLCMFKTIEHFDFQIVLYV